MDTKELGAKLDFCVFLKCLYTNAAVLFKLLNSTATFVYKHFLSFLIFPNESKWSVKI